VSHTSLQNHFTVKRGLSTSVYSYARLSVSMSCVCLYVYVSIRKRYSQFEAFHAVIVELYGHKGKDGDTG
jgi:hypothetical protein